MWENLKKIQEGIHNYWLWLCIAFLIFMLGLLRVWKHRPAKTILNKGDLIMTIEGRRLYVGKVCMECICDGILDAVLNGQITDDEANACMARLAKFFEGTHALKHEDIMPLIRKKKTAALKAQLRNNQRRRSLNGKRKPEVLPLPAEPKEKKSDFLLDILES